MKYNFDELIDRTGTRSVKLDAIPAEYPKDTVSLWVADMDFAVAQPIQAALHRRVDQGVFGYTMYNDPELKSAVTNWFARRYQWTVDPKDLFYCPGIVPAIAVLVNALTQPGDGILIQRPVYFPFTSQVENNQRIIYDNPLKFENGQYEMDFLDLDAKLKDPQVKGMILCSPHNPVGRVWTPTELRNVVDIAKKHNKWIISDEIHMDLTRRDVVHHPLVTLAPDYQDEIITCTAPTKTFNLAGLCISNIIITNPIYQAKWTQVVHDKYHMDMANLFGIEATIAAYNEGEEWLDQVKTYIDGNFDFLKKYCQENLPESVVVDSQGTYLGWIDVRAYCNDAEKLTDLMILANVLFNNGASFGDQGIGFIRINLAAPRAVVGEGIRRITEVLIKEV